MGPDLEEIMTEDPSYQPSDSVRRSTRALADLRLRLKKKQRSRTESRALGPDESVTEEAVDLCTMLLCETAAAERKLRTETMAREHLFNKFPLACVITDASGYIRSANPAAALLLGLSASALRGRLFLLFAEDRAGFHSLLQSQDGGTHYATLTLRPRDLRPMKVQVTIAPDAPVDATGWLWFIQPHQKFLSPSAPADDASS
jgi:PAS domain S-box-containing protein